MCCWLNRVESVGAMPAGAPRRPGVWSSNFLHESVSFVFRLLWMSGGWSRARSAV
jgi:hypothetical protein